MLPTEADDNESSGRVVPSSLHSDLHSIGQCSINLESIYIMRDNRVID